MRFESLEQFDDAACSKYYVITTGVGGWAEVWDIISSFCSKGILKLLVESIRLALISSDSFISNIQGRDSALFFLLSFEDPRCTLIPPGSRVMQY